LRRFKTVAAVLQHVEESHLAFGSKSQEIARGMQSLSVVLMS